MTTQNYFDLAKKKFEGGKEEDCFIARNGKPYHAYHTREEWKAFLEDMESHYNRAYNEYKEGGGGELLENRYPPKMASYGSSSRMIYELSRDIPGFHFEKKLGICVPAKNESQEAEASLDGYLADKCLYVEAKCREIYAESHPVFNVKYKEYYSFLNEHTGGLFNYSLKESIDKTGKVVYSVYFSWGGSPISHLDMKQLLCHLLGIAKQTLLDGGKQIPTLLYLVYHPSKELLDQVDSKRARKSIERCLETEKAEAHLIEIKDLYKCAVLFMHERNGIGQNLPAKVIDKISKSFVFKFCDQKEYLSILQ